MLQGKFRWKIILLLVVGFVSLSAGWYFLHRLQMKSIHSRFLEQAKRAEESVPPQYDRAVRFLRIYLLAKGDDADALARYGILLEDKLPQSGRTWNDALGAYDRVLALDSTNQDIRMRAAKLSVGLRRIDEALTHLNALQKAKSDDPMVETLSAECKWAKNKFAKNSQFPWDEIEGHYRAAIKRAPSKLDAYARLVQLLRTEQKKPLEATQVLEDLIRANPQLVRAHILRAQVRQSAGNDGLDDRPILAAKSFGLMNSPFADAAFLSATALLAPKAGTDLLGAEQDLASARSLAPDDAEMLLTSSSQQLLLAQQKGQSTPKDHLDRARVDLQRGIELYPKDTRFLTKLAAVEGAAGRRKEALDLLRTAQKQADGDERNGILWDLANLLIDSDLPSEAKDIIDQIKKGRNAAGRREYLEARIAIRQNRWQEAVGLLESARPLLAANPALAMRVDLFLAMCFEQMGKSDEQIAIYQRARRLDPLDPAPRLALIKLLSSLSRMDDAIEECNNLRILPQVGIGGDLLYARLLIIKNLRLAPADRDLAAANGVLKDIVQRDKSLAREVDLLKAEMAAAQGKLEQAKEILQNAKKTWPEQIELWTALASLQAPPEGLQILDEANAKFGDRAELRLARLRFVPAKKEEALAFLRPLSEKLEAMDRANHERILAALAGAFERAGDLTAAETQWQKLVELEPSQIQVRLFLFDFYLRTGNPDGMQKALASIDKMEQGAAGSLGEYGKAQFLIFRASQRMKQLGKNDVALTADEKRDVDEARVHLLAAKAKYPTWSRIAVSLATVAELQGDSEETLECLREAVRLKNRQLPVIKALVSQLMAKGKYAEANDVLRKLQEVEAITDANLQMRAAEISVYNRDAKRALELVLQAVPDDSKNYEDHLWKGQMLSVLNETKKSEASLRKAIELAADKPGPWVALIELLQTRVGDAKQAAAMLNEMKAKVPAANLPYALAHCYQVMGQTENAQKAYLEALALQPDNLSVLKSMVEFDLGSGRTKDAEPRLRKLLEPQAKAPADLKAWARRHLALAIGFQDDSDKQTEAMRLVEENLKSSPPSSEDQIAKGVLLASKPERRAEAIATLEQAYKAKEPNADQMFILASLYEASGNWPKARSYMENLLGKHANHAKYRGYLSVFIDKLLARNENSSAEGWLNTLQDSIEKHLKSPGPEPLANRIAQDSALLTRLVRRHPRLTAKILANRQMLKALTGNNGNNGGKENLLVAAEFLASCKLLDEALDLCEQALKEVPPHQVAAVAVTAISANNATPKQFQRAEAWVLAARQQKPDLLVVDSFLAILKERQGNYAEAETLYRGVLKREPGDLMAINNLAFLLGLQGKTDEANQLMQKALAKAGQAGELLDSRAAILRVQGKLSEAEKDIQAALKQEKTPYRLFHLAEILRSAGKTNEGMNAFKEADERGLCAEMVHLLERDSYLAFQAPKKN